MQVSCMGYGKFSPKYLGPMVKFIKYNTFGKIFQNFMYFIHKEAILVKI